MYDKNCFITATAIRRQVKKVFYKLPMSENSEAFGKYGPFLLWFFFYENFNKQSTKVVFLYSKP